MKRILGFLTAGALAGAIESHGQRAVMRSRTKMGFPGIEMSNTGAQGSDHIHTIWRERLTDYGAEFSF